MTEQNTEISEINRGEQVYQEIGQRFQTCFQENGITFEPNKSYFLNDDFTFHVMTDKSANKRITIVKNGLDREHQEHFIYDQLRHRLSIEIYRFGHSAGFARPKFLDSRWVWDSNSVEVEHEAVYEEGFNKFLNLAKSIEHQYTRIKISR